MDAKQAKQEKTAVQTLSRQFTGVVVSAKNDKTIVVRVDNVKKHPKYQKRYVVSRRYKVHDEKNTHQIGDKVVFVECRPLSRDKRWRVVA
ncbi:MAG: 30S ribosomal protein S17 [Patescibacteria group bacterium]|jgi:small subunit ribosomal protein S17